MEAIVLPKVTSDMPSCSMPFNEKWKHLVGLGIGFIIKCAYGTNNGVYKPTIYGRKHRIKIQ